MKRTHRRFHLYIWISIGVLVSCFGCIALFMRPYLPIMAEAEEAFTISSQKEINHTVVIIYVNKPLQYPTCLVYGIDDAQTILLGQLVKQGKYTFKTSLSVETISLFDQIHKHEILRTKLID